MPLVDAVLLFNTAPLFIPIIERIIFKQRTVLRVRLSLTIAFVGVGFIMKPTSGLINPYALLGLVAGAGLAVSQICLLYGTRHYSMFENMLHLYFFSSIVALVPLMLFGASFSEVSQELLGEAALIAFTLSAVSSLGNQYFRTLALATVEQAGVLAPYMYLSVVFSGVLGWLLWNQVPDFLSIIGIVLVLVQGLFLMVSPRVWLRLRSFNGSFR
jgi:drug/metabolite transporter (DMT)-like permease